jgi:hypothetical protein
MEPLTIPANNLKYVLISLTFPSNLKKDQTKMAHVLLLLICHMILI